MLTAAIAAAIAAAATEDAAGVMELKVVSEFIPAGDHEVVICDVVNWETPEAAAAAKQKPLYTGFLRKQGYL
jgi:flavin reductase (DIM6/NTAB) family NADH-FMN oxidoreductase RutF